MLRKTQTSRFSLILALVVGSTTPQLHAQEEECDSVALTSPSLVFAISALSTAVPLALAAGDPGHGNEATLLLGSGLVVGPAAGYVYRGAWGRALTGIGIRFGTVMGAVLARSSALRRGRSSVLPIEVVGVVALCGEALYDLIAVGPYVRDMNMRERVRRQSICINLSPTYRPKTRSVGLRVSLSY